ncbi:PREDICTED: uncharacterized protein LOC109169411 [Ipomoea nil]|uniref:uncharacterized protein LOC109169411 n=1 Tax=Ipomoea nil TaxID=35883 RepID=UPI0009016019|nr:PREDICTED: uncharacterized protein LOC109169411 [Ipomoea nil]
MESQETLSSPRSSEDLDLLERSTKRSKRATMTDDQRLMPSQEIVMVQETPEGGMEAGFSTNPTMEACGEIVPSAQTEPPRPPVDQRRSYMDSLMGRTGADPTRLDDQEEPSQTHDELIEEENDDPLCPTIRLTKEEVEKIRAPWRKSMILKVLGRRVGYAYMLRRLTSMWKPKSSMDLIALPNDYFLVRFGSIDDLEFALFEGPWVVLDHYLIVKPWEPDFDPMNDATKKMVVWARIPCIPMEYYDYIFLRKLGRRIGRAVRVDQATSMGSRGMFARICVEIDMRKPIISKFTYEGKTRHVAYEGLHLICFSCGLYGHAKENCPLLKKAGRGQEEDGEARAEAEHDNTDHTHADGARTGLKEAEDPKIPFGTWMIAPQRRGRPPAAGSIKNAKVGNGRGGGGGKYWRT